ncbi:MAG: hypothetical protein LDL33_00855 [Desulfomonile sp.]|nr:hypothetical protein [Desulfomonile sp.]
MEPETRQRMRKAWGFCERHAWAWLAVEASFRGGYLLGPAVLYEDLMERAVRLFRVYGPAQGIRVRIRVHEKGPCLMCELGYGPDSEATAAAKLIDKGRDLYHLRLVAERTRPYWQMDVCGVCVGTNSTMRCRKHFVQKANVDSVEHFRLQKEFLTNLFPRVANFLRSFRWEYRDTQTVEDMAALISAVGWCSGWTIFLELVE